MGSIALMGWNMETLQRSVLTLQAVSVRQILLKARNPIPLGITEMNHMLAFAASYQQSKTKYQRFGCLFWLLVFSMAVGNRASGGVE
ncbi:hypothetical protein BWQ96_05093 [Gracilariopsis chorda]|uniref:Uncharacterized protein n=1 Tax=Gracilariopsis chorda TaxID=448386 RepID=A0A2V3ISW6_9FLOR|nr:hypothetical protein BWQ96_05093 [Gracilariopsis chorda]|eukprot:PXF45192.1 hypothetical protein BWQ96_05093 [Gracilariopsis chorda]